MTDKVGKMRRVVTGHDPSGRAGIVEDGDAPVVKVDEARPAYAMTQLWITDPMRVPIGNHPDPTQRPISLSPPANGSVVRIVDFPPASLELTQADAEAARKAFAMYGQDEALTQNASRPARHPFMHRTETIDYAVVLSGEITMLLDDSEVHLTQGDILIQRGTHHAWTNRSEQTCRMLFVLLDGNFEPEVGQAIKQFDEGG